MLRLLVLACLVGYAGTGRARPSCGGSIGIREARAMALRGASVLPELRAILKGGDVARQRIALYALGELGPEHPEIVADVLPFVKKDPRELRLNALGALGKVGPRAAAAVPALVAALDDGDGGVATEARRALVKIGLVALPAIGRGSRTYVGTDDDLRTLTPGFTIAEHNRFYGRIQPERSVDELIRIVAAPGDRGFDKDFALKDLARVGVAAKAALPALIGLLSGDASEGKRELAAHAIGALGKDAVSALPALTDALDDCEADVRFTAAWALASVGADALPSLKRVVERGTPRARLSAARALEMIHTRKAWDLLRGYWKKAGVEYPYDDGKLKALIGPPT